MYVWVIFSGCSGEEPKLIDICEDDLELAKQIAHDDYSSIWLYVGLSLDNWRPHDMNKGDWQHDVTGGNYYHLARWKVSTR